MGLFDDASLVSLHASTYPPVHATSSASVSVRGDVVHALVDLDAGPVRGSAHRLDVRYVDLTRTTHHVLGTQRAGRTGRDAHLVLESHLARAEEGSTQLARCRP